ncbi:MAG: DNA internalization-related competence protein ComEC/Rec2 [Methylococcaceae bacterium]|nr:MAG: DNA internalization-related competence protein ComEC/Rec2 [Methylococcaceae bacterium]
MIVTASGLLIALVLIQQLADLPELSWLLLAVILLLPILWRRHWRLAVIIMGIMWALSYAHLKLADRLPNALDGLEVSLTGVIDTLPVQQTRAEHFDFLVQPRVYGIPQKIRVYAYTHAFTFKAGQHWRLHVKLKTPHGTLNPHGFDYEQKLFHEGIGAIGSLRTSPAPVLLGQDNPFWTFAMWRQRLHDKLATLTQLNGVFYALILGDGSRISQAEWEVFRNTGTTHLMVISGSHISLIAGLVYFLSAKLWAYSGILRWSPQRVAALMSLLAGYSYAALAGFSIPTLRAVIMLSVVLMALICQRHTQVFSTLAMALLTVLIIDPFAVASIGFWLSFLAVALIIYTVTGRLGASTHAWLTALRIHWATSLGLMPLLVYFFHSITFTALIANVIAEPIIGVIVIPITFFAVMVMGLLPDVSDYIFSLLNEVIDLLLLYLGYLARLPYATLNQAAPPFWSVLLASLGCLLLLAPKGIPNRWTGALLCLPLLFPRTTSQDKGRFTLTLLDVGQGLSIVVNTQSHWLVFDTGAKFSKDSDQGKSVVLPFLQGQGVQQLDALIISHGDNDHRGGLASILNSMPTQQLMTRSPTQLIPYRATVCQTGQQWVWDDVSFTVLAPAWSNHTGNNNSCVLKIDSAEGSALLTGDIEAEAERSLINQSPRQLRAQLLIAPHHGSKTSSTEDFLTTVAPNMILIPAGFHNQFGHPHAHVIQRYQRLNIPYLNTAEQGAISVEFNNKQMQLHAYREIARRYWHNNPIVQ